MTSPKPVDPTNTDVPPVCAAPCPYRQRFTEYDKQRNALRSELVHMVSEWRCGWNLIAGRLGGHPLDYAPCYFNPAQGRAKEMKMNEHSETSITDILDAAPCKKCGSTKVAVQWKGTHGDFYSHAVECYDCDNAGPRAETMLKAAQAWRDQ